MFFKYNQFDLADERFISFHQDEITSIDDVIPSFIIKYIDEDKLKFIHKPSSYYNFDYPLFDFEDKEEALDFIEEWVEIYPQFEGAINRAAYPEFLKYGRFLEKEEVFNEVDGKKVLNPYRLYIVLNKLIEFKDFFKSSDEPYKTIVPPRSEINDKGQKVSVMGYARLHPKLSYFHDLVYMLKIPDYAHAYENKFYGDVMDNAFKRFNLKNPNELCKQDLNYVEIFSFITASVRACRMDESFLASFVECGNAYNLILRCEQLVKELEENELKEEIRYIDDILSRL